MEFLASFSKLSNSSIDDWLTESEDVGCTEDDADAVTTGPWELARESGDC